MIPSHCFNGGICSFEVTQTEHEICSILCGTTGRLNFTCPSNFTDTFVCPNKNYEQEYTKEGADGLNRLKIKFHYCHGGCSNDAFATLFPVWRNKPTFHVSTSRFSIYDEIDHNILIEGENFDSFYQPYFLIRFDKSKLLSVALKQSCQLIINCEISSETSLTCYKPAFNLSCTPKSSQEMGDWKADAYFYSHNVRQPESVFNKRFSVNNKPKMNSIRWDSNENKVIIGKTGYIFPNTTAVCHKIGQRDKNFSAPTDFIDSKTIFFILNDYGLVKKTINCSLSFDKHVFPIGTVTIDSMHYDSILGITTQEAILISSIGLILMLAGFIGAWITYSVSTREEKAEKQGEIVQSSIFKALKAKVKTIPSMQTGQFSL